LRLAGRVDELRGLLAGHDPEEVERFFLRMPRRYLLGLSPQQIAAHVPLLLSRPQPTEVRTLAGRGVPHTGPRRVVALVREKHTLVAGDRHYKKAVSDEIARGYLWEDAKAGKVDEELLRIFIEAGICRLPEFLELLQKRT